jgi:MFS transporter, SHS family, lactate transporter
MTPYFVKNLIPHREARKSARPLLTALRGLTWLQWAHYFSGWLAWTCDATDFFSVSLSINALSTQFGKDTTAITQAITLTLLLRSVGAIIFGILSDRYGRKWPMVANLLIITVLQLSVGFVTTYPQFLGLRALFGIGMGGIWGMAVSTALENLPVEVRGLASGLLQQGYAVGYLIAAVIELFLVPKTVETSWRTLFWTAAGISAFAAAVTAVLPESEVFLEAQRKMEQSGKERLSSGMKTKQFIKETSNMLKTHKLRCIYGVLIMAGKMLSVPLQLAVSQGFLCRPGFNFLAHGSQDLYPVYITKNKLLSSHAASAATIIGSCVSP